MNAMKNRSHPLLTATFSLTFVLAVRAASAASPDLPVITNQPQSLFVTQGSNATFSVTAVSSLPLRYQWYRNSLPIEGETNANLDLNGVQESHRGLYHVLIRNAVAALASQVAYLIPSPIVASNVGGAVVFATRGSGVNALLTQCTSNLPCGSDQWAAQLYAGLPGSPPDQFVPIGLPAATRSSRALAGYVVDGLRFIPYSVVPAGENAAIQVRAWNIYDGDTWESAYLRWQSASNSHGIGFSETISLRPGIEGSTVNPPPLMLPLTFRELCSLNEFLTVTNLPQSQTALAGSSVSFRIDASGCSYSLGVECWETGTNGGQGHFQWRKNGELIEGASSHVLTLTNISLSDAATYNVAVHTGRYRVMNVSLPFSLTVLEAPVLRLNSKPAHGNTELEAVSAAGLRLSLQASSNLVTWLPIGTMSNETGTVRFTEPEASGAPVRFYRIQAE